MQISETNNNLLNVVARLNIQQESETEDKSFASLLQLAGIEADIDTQKAELEPSVEKRIQPKAKQVVKTTEPQDIRVQNPEQKVLKEENVKPAEKEAKAIKEENNVVNVPKNEDITQEVNAPEMPTEEEQIDLSAIVPVFESHIALPVENIVIADAPVPVLENEMVVVSSEEIEPELIQTKTEPVQGELFILSEDTSAIAESGKTIEAEKANISIEQPQNLSVDGEYNTEKTSVEMKQQVVKAQEEKIAEILPEDKKIEIKVAVTEDKVTEPKNTQILSVESAESIDETNSQEIKQDKTLEIVPTKEVENTKSAEIKDIETEKVDVISQDKQAITIDSKVADSVNTVASVEAIAPVVGEIKAVVSPTETTDVKGIYNKGLTREVAEQIKVNITQSAIKGIDKIEIQLKPADLGQVDIKLQISRDGRLHAHIIASNPETLEMLEKDSSLLKEAFNNAGYQTEDNNFSFSYRGNEQGETEREKLREFIGEVITQDVAEETAANDYIRTDGVNIRV